ncbi:hypothetical protein EEB11_06970, partial [Pseudotabrizicola sediminis]
SMKSPGQFWVKINNTMVSMSGTMAAVVIPPVRNLVRLVSRLKASDRGIGQGHGRGSTFSAFARHPQKHPHTGDISAHRSGLDRTNGLDNTLINKEFLDVTG